MLVCGHFRQVNSRKLSVRSWVLPSLTAFAKLLSFGRRIFRDFCDSGMLDAVKGSRQHRGEILRYANLSLAFAWQDRLCEAAG